MKKNIYTEKVSKIRVSDEMLNKAIDNIRNADTADKVIKLEKPKTKQRIFRISGAVAAMLALVIALGALQLSDNTKSNPFVLTTSAAEITDNAYVKVSSLDMNGTGICYYSDADNPNIITALAVSRNFNLNIRCSGDNIKNVTYTTDCGYLLFYTDDDGVVDYTPLPEEEYVVSSDSGFYHSMTPAVSCTFSYEKRPGTLANSYYDPNGDVPLYITLTAQDTELRENIDDYRDDDGTANINILAEKVFERLPSQFNIEITATLSDGTKETQTVQLICETGKDTPFILSAKIDN